MFCFILMPAKIFFVDLVYDFSCEEILLDKKNKTRDLHCIFWHRFLTKSSCARSRRIDGKASLLPRKIRIFLDIFRLCIFDETSMSLLQSIILLSNEVSKDENIIPPFNTESFFSKILYCIYDTSDVVMKMISVNEYKKQFPKKRFKFIHQMYLLKSIFECLLKYGKSPKIQSTQEKYFSSIEYSNFEHYQIDNAEDQFWTTILKGFGSHVQFTLEREKGWHFLLPVYWSD